MVKKAIVLIVVGILMAGVIVEFSACCSQGQCPKKETHYEEERSEEWR